MVDKDMETHLRVVVVVGQVDTGKMRVVLVLVIVLEEMVEMELPVIYQELL
jgi:hypothetical protein